MIAVSGVLLDAPALADLARQTSVFARAALETSLARGHTVATTGAALTLALAEVGGEDEPYEWLVRETADLESIHVFVLDIAAVIEVAATMRTRKIPRTGLGHLVHLAHERDWSVLTDQASATRLTAFGVRAVALP